MTDHQNIRATLQCYHKKKPTIAGSVPSNLSSSASVTRRRINGCWFCGDITCKARLCEVEFAGDAGGVMELSWFSSRTLESTWNKYIYCWK